ncbi:SACE_7040 family transcriptional regulator [Mycolicibacterium alvei]|uniref:TetR family transcriptional regulator n=1 Tax=Mycolicibacterium alvei TaxID=67081 RepID=A0A6N4V0L4_9MYCO|nr:TetR/AcrR family transcriptional regulator [Mycolicibacterium alvei]MCV7003312.1 TetR/AcrR family transcriptional regulator [Mycolicibacterium alvei]BBX30269.1 TetR family transcriptional regulator [Mycolicibacterium alvei]
MSDSAVTRRSKAKSDRRTQLIAAAERLVAERGYLAVRLEDICSAVGISAPAIYRHFPNKEALLVELLVGISARLLTGAQAVTARNAPPVDTLNDLVDFHLDFVFGEPDLIRIQDRDLAHLPDTAKRQVRRSQRQYVEIWVAVLTQLNPDLAEDDARVMAHAAFGLLNSTPYSVRPAAPKTHSRAVLRRMTLAALTA